MRPNTLPGGEPKPMSTPPDNPYGEPKPMSDPIDDPYANLTLISSGSNTDLMVDLSDPEPMPDPPDDPYGEPAFSKSGLVSDTSSSLNEISSRYIIDITNSIKTILLKLNFILRNSSPIILNATNN